MDDQFVQYSELNGIVTIILNRPEKRNAWNEQMREDMKTAVHQAINSSDTRVLIIRGNGGAFSAGEDVTEMIERFEYNWTTRDFRRMARNIHNVFDELEAAEIPVIAAIDGVCVCGGLELALSCDFRIATNESRFGLIEGNVGFIPGSGGCSRLVKIAGLGVAKEIVLGGEIFSAQEAMDKNLINKVVPRERFHEEVKLLAEKLSRKAPLTLGMAKILLNLCADSNFNTGRHLERFGQSILMETDDHLEAATAFLEKRKPHFIGK